MNSIGRTVQDLTLLLAYATWRRRYLVILPILLMPFVGLLVAKFAPEQYSAKTTLLVQEPAAINPFLEDLAISTDLKDRMDALVGQMRTRSTLNEIATDVGWIGVDTPSLDIDAKLDALRSNMRIYLVGSEVVEIAYTASQSLGMSRVVNAIAERFVDQLLAPARSSVEASERFLGEERERFKEELRQSESELTAFKSENAEKLPELHVQNVQGLAQTRRQLAELQAELAGQEARLELGTVRLAETDPVIGRIDASLAGLREGLSELLVRYTEGHSEVRLARAEILALTQRRADLENESRGAPEEGAEKLWNMLSDANSGEHRSLMQDQLGFLEEARTRVDLLRRQISSLQERESELSVHVRDFAVVESQIASLEREVSVKRELLERLSQRYEMARVTGALGRNAAPDLVRVIDQPRDPSHSNSWPTLIYLLCGLAGGVAVGAGLAFVAELLDTSITRPALIVEMVGLQVVGRLPPFDAIQRQISISAEGDTSQIPGMV